MTFTETELIDLVTAARCLECREEWPVDLSHHQVNTVDDLLGKLAADCGCPAPFPYGVIISNAPVFGDPAIDDHHHVRSTRLGLTWWEYQVDDMFVDALTAAGVLEDARRVSEGA
jgi:hypothetical protein